ncbi:MAG: GNAT family N-acetyltransferase [Steroidobacteraceae bacterium]
MVRAAVSADRDALLALQRRASLGNEGDRDALLRHPDAIDIPLEQIASGRVFVLEHGAAIVGFSAILPRPDGDTELDALFVEPNAQRRGYGRLLVEHCAKEARTAGSTTLHVVGNPHAEKFYAACGFKLVGTFETRFGPGLLLRKKI